MNKTYHLEGFDIRISLQLGLARIYADGMLWNYLDSDKQKRLDLLIQTLKADHYTTFNRPLAITDNSMMVEIVAHVYSDYIGLLFNRLVRVKLIQNQVKKLIKRAEIIDCGEKECDSNRWLWNLLENYYLFFIRLLPRKLNKKELK